MKPIFSDDPNAIDKLKAKLAHLEGVQDQMKRVNKLYKIHGREVFNMVELSDAGRQNIEYNLATPYYHNVPYPKFYLTNNGAVIRATKQRIIELTKKQEATA
jgi:hypothetical protein